jgi:hypothetical protein
MLQCREAKGYLGGCGEIGKFGLFLSEGPSGPSVLGAIPYTTFRGACGRAFALADQAGPFLKFAGMVGVGPRLADHIGQPPARRCPAMKRSVMEGIAPRTQGRMALRKTNEQRTRSVRKAERPSRVAAR